MAEIYRRPTDLSGSFEVNPDQRHRIDDWEGDPDSPVIVWSMTIPAAMLLLDDLNRVRKVAEEFSSEFYSREAVDAVNDCLNHMLDLGIIGTSPDAGNDYAWGEDIQD